MKGEHMAEPINFCTECGEKREGELGFFKELVLGSLCSR